MRKIFMNTRSTTLTQVAHACGVSLATASYALRRHPKIGAETVARVEAMAERMGYRQNARVAALMAHIRQARPVAAGERLALVWMELGKGEEPKSLNRQILDGVTRRAARLGYRLEQFWLSEPGMTAARLGGILRSRGISGVIFSFSDHETEVQLNMDWRHLSCVVIGNAQWSPDFVRAGHNHYAGMKRVMEEVARAGQRNPVCVLESVVNTRAGQSWEAAFRAMHPRPAQAHRALRVIDTPEEAEGLSAWLETRKADVVIASSVRVARSLQRLGVVNKGTPFLSLSVEQGQGFAGIDQGYERIVEHAVDLLAGQLQHNESGVPESPGRMLFEGFWRDADW
jgi:LacI family transcriptional regulator